MLAGAQPPAALVQVSTAADCTTFTSGSSARACALHFCFPSEITSLSRRWKTLSCAVLLIKRLYWTRGWKLPDRWPQNVRSFLTLWEAHPRHADKVFPVLLNSSWSTTAENLSAATFHSFKGSLRVLETNGYMAVTGKSLWMGFEFTVKARLSFRDA